MKISLEKDYDRAFKLALEALREEELIIFPTDTLYGIGGDATSPEVVQRVYAAKERDRGKPLAVIMGGLGMIMEWCELYQDGGRMIMEHLPGPYTFIVKLKKGKTLAGQEGKIGVRVPNHFFLRKLALEFGKPIIATSANLSGNEGAFALSQVDGQLIKAVKVAIDGGETAHRAPSTVVDLVERKIVRMGAGEFEFK